ncbi:MAG: hydroxymethylbilane synthase [Candidatus Omnitrophica bacterium]|nr:hydroxymethylbilane synthase [Candidatus Omnitrophota bacterium]
MIGNKLRIGTRTSLLALKQVEEVLDALKKFYHTVNYEIVGIDTYGDKDKVTPLSDMEGSDFFTREIEEALLENKIDFAVHSAKDMPDVIPDGLVVACVTKSIDPYDALVSKGNLKINELKPNAKIGVSSQRRKNQLKQFRPDFKIIDIRGNIQERLEKLNKENLDAIVVAACALVRLGLQDLISQRIPCDILSAHPLQGALAIEVRHDNKALKDWLGVLNEQ